MHQPLTPDYYHYEWTAIDSAFCSNTGSAVVTWHDGKQLTCHPLWLRENAPGPGGIDPRSRENDLDIVDLNLETRIEKAFVENGALVVHFEPEGRQASFHPGWLRHIADGQHQTFALLPQPHVWTSTELIEPPTHDGPSVLASDEALANWLKDLIKYGLARLTCLPTDHEIVELVGNRIGVLRDSNFGLTWHVSVDIDPNSTANTNLGLPAHSDLPSRETPPGFQLLHCQKNTASGGKSTMTDGLAVVNHLEMNEPKVLEMLTSRQWTFFNRDEGQDHRWTGPIIDTGDGRVPWTFRAFHPVRGFPAMPEEDIGDAYAALQRFGYLTNCDKFQIRYEFAPGDLVAFDNRRVLHGRESFDTTAGARRLRGTYLDSDEVYSRMRVLRRHLTSSKPSQIFSATGENSNA